MDNPICIYHFPCADGFAAAWVVNDARSGNVEMCPRNYDQPPPDVAGRDVIMVDFSYKFAVMSELAKRANSIVVLDHHASAERELAPFVVPGADKMTKYNSRGVIDNLRSIGRPPVAAQFDMNRSGARMAWDYFYPHLAPPQLLLHIEDRDLWRFDLPGTKEIQAALFSYPYDFGAWSALINAPVDTLHQEGAAIDRKQSKDINEFIGRLLRRMSIGGHDVPVMSIPYTMVSEAGHILAQGEPFAACYWDTAEHRIFGLRSDDNGVDVSQIAEQYGGGGHRHAAGFQVPRTHALARM